MATTRTTSKAKPRADANSAGPQLGALQMVAIELIDADDRLRLVDPSKAGALAEELQREPLRSPVLVVGPGAEGRFRLIFGGTRLEAHRINGATEILSRVLPEDGSLDENDFRLMEIAENVQRFELTVLDRSVSVAEWRRIHEVRHGKVKKGRPKGNSAPSAQLSDAELDEASSVFSGTFSEGAQAAFGLAPRSIYEALKIATIDADVRRRIAFHRVANSKTELLQLAGEATDRQSEIARLLTDNQVLTVSEAIASIDHQPAPKRPAPVERVSSAFAALKQKDQFAFFDMHGAAIDQWLLTRNRK